jgi:RND family efflux transporter MFP subunit
MPSSSTDLLRRLRCILIALALSATASACIAHEGHDHAASPPVAVAKSSPRIVAQSEAYELVGILVQDTLRIYLDRFETNEPVSDAAIVVTVGGNDVTASPVADGTYAISDAALAGEGPLEMIFAITASSGDDLLIATLDRPAASAVPTTASGPIEQAFAKPQRPELQLAGFAIPQPYLIGGIALLVGFGLGAALHRPRRVMATGAIGLAALVATTAFALSHDGHDHGPGNVTPTPSGDAPSRLSDGSIFVPKPTQRLLDVRTLVAKPELAHRAVNLIGRVIADPNRSGLVQSINGGRIISPEEGLPRLGQVVVKGEVLALVEQALSQADQTGIAEQSGAIEQEIAIVEVKLERARTLAQRGVAAQSQVSDAETELVGLRRRLETIARSRLQPETLEAPVDGVIAEVHVVAGQVLGSADTVFHIVDPDALWVEALVYGEIDPGTLTGASAVASNGAELELSFEGFSKALQQQATRVHFSIVTPPANLGIGQPVQVFARNGPADTAIVLPRDSVLRGANGESIVWRHTEAERFEGRPVRTEPFDAKRVIVHAGIDEGDRIVVKGAELINQVR